MADSTIEKTCFIIMPVTTPEDYSEQSGDPAHFPHVLDFLFTPALQDVGYRIIPPSVLGADLIHAEIIKNLEKADLVLCDMSSLNPNVFFELGIRTSLDRPVVMVKDSITPKLPFDVNAINTHTYEMSLDPWVLKAEVPRLASYIRAATTDESKTGNAMWRYFGLTKRATPSEAAANPLEAKIDIVLDELAKWQFRTAPARPVAVSTSGGELESPRITRLKTAVGQAVEAELGQRPKVVYFPESKIIYIETTERIPPSMRDTLQELLSSDINVIYDP
jgi:hypothetical protein